MSCPPCVAGAVLGLMLGACDGSGSSAAPDAADPGAVDGGGPVLDSEAGAGTDAAAAGPPDPLAPDAGSDPSSPGRPQTNLSFDTALQVPTDGTTQLQDERSATQVDYYVFSAEAGRFYEITTDRHPFSPDNRIALYGPDRSLLAENDVGSIWPGDAIDARLIVRAAVAGDYFVRVEDPWTPERFFSGSFPLLFYHLRVRELDRATAGFVHDSESTPAAVAFEADAETGYAYATLIGVTGGELDVFAFEGVEQSALIGRLLGLHIEPEAEDRAWSQIVLLDADENALAEIGSELGQRALHPPVEDAPYELQIQTTDALDPSSEPAFYAVDLVLIPDNPRELDDQGNGELAGAEPIVLEGSTQRRGLLLTTLPSGDVDYFAFDAEAGERARVLCEGESGGSRVRGLRAELHDAADAVLGTSSTESPTENLEIQAVELAAGGTHYLRLSAESDAASVPAMTWARCSLSLGR